MANFRRTSAEKKKCSFRQMNYSHFFHLSLVSKTGLAFYAFIFLNRISVFFHFCIFPSLSLASETGLAPTHSIKKLKSIFSEKEEGEQTSHQYQLKREILFGILLIVPLFCSIRDVRLQVKANKDLPHSRCLPRPPVSMRR